MRLPYVYMAPKQGKTIQDLIEAMNCFAKKFSVEEEVKVSKVRNSLNLVNFEISDNALKEMFGVSFYAFTPSESLGIPIPRDLEPYVKFIEVESVENI